jgi:hypothetical protein
MQLDRHQRPAQVERRCQVVEQRNRRGEVPLPEALLDRLKLLRFGRGEFDAVAADERARQPVAELRESRAAEIGMADGKIFQPLEGRQPPERRAELGRVDPRRQRPQVAGAQQSGRNAVFQRRPADIEDLQMRVVPKPVAVVIRELIDGVDVVALFEHAQPGKLRQIEVFGELRRTVEIAFADGQDFDRTEAFGAERQRGDRIVDQFHRAQPRQAGDFAGQGGKAASGKPRVQCLIPKIWQS